MLTHVDRLLQEIPVYELENTPTGAGMGTSGLVGQFGTFAAMGETPTGLLLVEILVLHFVAPAVLTLVFDGILRKLGWVRDGDMKIVV